MSYGASRYITHPRHKLPRLRGQPKIHKISDSLLLDELTFRPIISGKNGPLSGLSQLLDKVLRPLADHMVCRIRDSFDAIEKINSIDFSKYSVHTFDASSLYTSFDLDLVKKAFHFWLHEPDFRLFILDRFQD